MNRLVPLFLTSILLLVGGCNDSNNNGEDRIGHFDEVDEESVYFDYRVMAEEGDDNLTVMLRYRDGGPNGSSLIVDEAGKVELDGERIMVDSSALTGAFYEVQKPIATFSGKHRISFSHRKKKYQEEFHFEPMVFRTELPDTVDRGDLVMELDGIEPEDYVLVLLFDTTARDEINRLDTVRNGLLSIRSADLEQLANGDIHLELHREYEKEVGNGTPEGGRIYISYVLKRKFFLRDPARKSENQLR